MQVKDMERKYASEISIDEMWRHLEYIASIDRTSGTEGEFRAVNYLTEQLKKYGVESHVYEYNGYLSYPLDSGVTVVSEGNKVIESKTRSFSGNTPPEGVVGELIYIPGGKDMFTDTETQKHLAKVELTGKIVLSEGGGRQNMIFAQKRGAIGYIHMWPSDEDVIHEGIVTPVWGTPTPEKLNSIPKIPVVSIKNRDGMYLKNALSRGPVIIRLYSKTDTNWRGQKLLEARIQGSSSDFVLIGGHIDSWHLGATDNATGNVVCLELARTFKKYQDQLKRGLRIAWWPGHSTGRYGGSTWYCDNFWFDIYEHCVAYINIDSPGVVGATDYSEVTAVAETANLALAVVKEITGQDAKWVRPDRAGDQSFWGPGVSSIYMLLSNRPHGMRAKVGGSGMGWWWHTEQDILDKVGKEVLLKDAQIYGTAAWRLCNTDILPLDVKSSIKELCNIVADLEKSSEGLFDLSPVKQELFKLTDIADRFVAMEANLDDIEVEEYNKHLLSALRLITQINYTEYGPFEHDPAVPFSPMPGLKYINELPALKGNPDIGFYFTKLVRNRNRVVYALKNAFKTLEEFAKGRMQ